ncbi:hypothetical protein J0H58_20355 [bacterium]|nr:hypothetical protein [bacterium]
MSLRDLIERADDRKVAPVEVPEWNCTVYLRQLSVDERNTLISQLNEDNAGRFPVYVLLSCLCDERGNPVFTNKDYAVLAGKNARVVDRLGREASRLNYMTGDALDDAKKD